MPQSTELILELKWETVQRMAQDYLRVADTKTLEKGGWTAENLDFALSDGSEDPGEHKYMMIELAAETVRDRLSEIHFELCERRWPGVKKKKPYPVITTSEGKREISPFDLATYGYEDEPYEYVGIGMTSRYYPTWIDWRDPHGGSGHFRLDAEAMEMIEEARVAIAEVIPEIKDAPCTAAPNFY